MRTFSWFIILIGAWTITLCSGECKFERNHTFKKGYECKIGKKGNLRFQDDGNMVIYDQKQRAKWNSKTDGKGKTAIFQKDGNLVIYNNDGGVAWSTGTKGKGQRLVFHDDRNLAIYDSNGKVVWESETGIGRLWIHVDTAGATDLDAYANKGKTLIEREYKRMSRYFTYPDYDPPTSVYLFFDPEDHGIYASGNLINIAAAWPRKTNYKDYGVFIHEFTHVMQSYGCPGWIVEGIAEYFRRFLYKIPEDGPVEKPKDSEKKWENGYSDAGYLLDWVQKNYKVDIVYRVNQACQEGKYNDNMFKNLTGKDIPTLWDEMMHQFDYLN